MPIAMEVCNQSMDECCFFNIFQMLTLSLSPHSLAQAIKTDNWDHDTLTVNRKSLVYGRLAGGDKNRIFAIKITQKLKNRENKKSFGHQSLELRVIFHHNAESILRTKSINMKTLLLNRDFPVLDFFSRAITSLEYLNI